MLRQIKTQSRAQWALTLIGWVVFVCLSQNAGILNTCSVERLVALSENSQTLTDTQDNTPNEKCELTEKLLNHSAPTWNDATLSILVLAFILVAWLLATTSPAPIQTEPIPSPRRLHLTLCVFLE